MIQEAIEHIATTALRDQEPKFIHRDGDPAHVGYKRTAGDLVRVELDPPPRRIECTRLDDLIRWAHRPPVDLQDVVTAGHAAVFIGPSAVELVFDMRTRRERAVLALQASDEVEFFAELGEDDHIITVDALRAALRYRLTECKVPAVLLDQISKLAKRTDSEASVERTRATESLGKSVTTRVANEADMPAERQRFSVRPYANDDIEFRQYVEFMLDPELNTMRWYLRPIASSWLALWRSAGDMIEGQLMKGLDGTGIHLVRGSVG